MRDFEGMMKAYESNSTFNQHPLFVVAVRVFSYLKMISKKKSKYNLYFRDRIELLSNQKKLSKKSKNITISEEDLVIFKYLSRVCAKVEIVREQGIEEYYFQILPKCFYLSGKTKNSFLLEVDRTSEFTKINSIFTNLKYFEMEMNHNANQFRRFHLIYRFFGSGNTYYFEVSIISPIKYLLNIFIL